MVHSELNAAFETLENLLILSNFITLETVFGRREIFHLDF